jgi:hypothetical protein
MSFQVLVLDANIRNGHLLFIVHLNYCNSLRLTITDCALSMFKYLYSSAENDALYDN